MNAAAKYFPLDDAQPGAIRPEMLAKKIADVRRLKFPVLAKYFETQPRALEALWFLQWTSMQPGGLRKLVNDLIAFIGPCLGTESMRAFGQRKYTREECLKAWSELPYAYQNPDEDVTGDWHAYEQTPEGREAEKKAYLKNKQEMDRERFTKNEPHLRETVIEVAQSELVLFLEKLCVGELEDTSRWYCPDVLAEVIAFMDERAGQVEARLAETVVAVKVFDALDYANSERVMVRIEGDSRFGKSEAVETWAAMWPGRARVVRTPPSNNERDLYRAVAEAFGIHQTFGSRGETLKDKVEFVIRFSGIMVIFDEGAFLLPSNITATTAPARLNWIRSAIVDRKVPCVIVVTPQSYNGAVNRFVKKTQYSIEQFLGREAMRVPLPNELPHEDLVSVAQVHFPEADDDLLELIAGTAMQSESYLKAVENIARRARYNAQKRGAKRLALRDVEKAIGEVMPAPSVATPKQAAQSAPLKAPAKRLNAPEGDIKAAFSKGRTERISSLPRRAVTPIETELEEAATA
jgi:hypothetical protein